MTCFLILVTCLSSFALPLSCCLFESFYSVYPSGNFFTSHVQNCPAMFDLLLGAAAHLWHSVFNPTPSFSPLPPQKRKRFMVELQMSGWRLSRKMVGQTLKLYFTRILHLSLAAGEWMVRRQTALCCLKTVTAEEEMESGFQVSLIWKADVVGQADT